VTPVHLIIISILATGGTMFLIFYIRQSEVGLKGAHVTLLHYILMHF